MSRLEKLVLLIIAYFIANLYMTFKLFSISNILSSLYSLIIIIILFLLLKKFEKRLKIYFGVKDNKIEIFSFKDTYWSFWGATLMTIFLPTVFFMNLLNTISHKTTYISGVVVKKYHMRAYGASINLKQGNTVYILNPPYKDYKKIKIGKKYEIKLYKGWLGIKYYWRKEFKYRVLNTDNNTFCLPIISLFQDCIALKLAGTNKSKDRRAILNVALGFAISFRL